MEERYLESGQRKRLISIDGPAASGKSSLSRLLAKKLSWKWLSTGVFYRGLAWMALDQNKNSEEEIAQLAKDMDRLVHLESDRTAFFYQGKDITEEIYTEEVDKQASRLAEFYQVRKALLPAQEQCFLNNSQGLIAEGRDCGTVVFPLAGLKIYLEAQENIRAQRRASQRGLMDIEQVSALQKKRDDQDSFRANSPLSCASDAVVIDTSAYSLEEMVEKVYQYAVELFQKP